MCDITKAVRILLCQKLDLRELIPKQGSFGTTVAYEQNGGDWREPTSWVNRSFYNRFPMFANPVLASPGGFAFGVSDVHFSPMVLSVSINVLSYIINII